MGLTQEAMYRILPIKEVQAMKIRALYVILLGIFLALLIPTPRRAAAQDGWEEVLAKAKKEGQVSVMGPIGTDTRDALTQPFQKKYGITVNYFGGRGGQQSARVGMERRAGKYLWDIFVGGTTTGLTSMIPIKAFDPMEPSLFPEIKNPKNWRDGEMEFADPGRQLLVMTPTHRILLVVNPDLAKPSDFKSYKDMLKPKWKGKIAFSDPRRPGSVQASFTFFYLHPDLGVKFIRALAANDPIVMGDPALALDSLTRGKYPVLLGPRGSILQDALRRGLPVRIVDPSKIKEGSDISPGPGALGLMNRPAHPNAAKIYLNWLLSKEGQYIYAKSLNYVSTRLDVPNDYYKNEPWRVPSPGAIKTYDLAAMKVKPILRKLLGEIFGGRRGRNR